MNSPAVDIKNILAEEEGLNLIFAENLFISQEPTAPDNCVTIYDRAGGGEDLFLNPNISYSRPAVHIRVRNNKYIDGWNVANDIKSRLHAIGNIAQGGSYYTLIRCDTGPSGMKYDENDRAILELEFSIQRRPQVIENS